MLQLNNFAEGTNFFSSVLYKDENIIIAEIILPFFFLKQPFFISLRDLWVNLTTVQCLIDKSALSSVFRRITSDRVNREVSPS